MARVKTPEVSLALMVIGMGLFACGYLGWLEQADDSAAGIQGDTGPTAGEVIPTPEEGTAPVESEPTAESRLTAEAKMVIHPASEAAVLSEFEGTLFVTAGAISAEMAEAVDLDSLVLALDQAVVVRFEAGNTRGLDIVVLPPLQEAEGSPIEEGSLWAKSPNPNQPDSYLWNPLTVEKRDNVSEGSYFSYFDMYGNLILRHAEIDLAVADGMSDRELWEALQLEVRVDGELLPVGETDRGELRTFLSPGVVRIAAAAEPEIVATMRGEGGFDLTLEPSATPTNTPEATARPTPTETKQPLYWQCGAGDPPRLQGRGHEDAPIGPDGRGLPTGIDGPGALRNGYFTYISLRACLVGVEGFTDPVLGEDAVVARVVFFDRFGEAHEYPIMMGGTRAGGEASEIAICTFDAGERVNFCSFAAAQETLDSLTDFLEQNRKTKQINIDMITRDRGAPWLDTGSTTLTERINNQSDFYEALMEAIETGENFPEPPDDPIFVWQIYLYQYRSSITS